jgi:flagellar motor switch protein FliN/FliY
MAEQTPEPAAPAADATSPQAPSPPSAEAPAPVSGGGATAPATSATEAAGLDALDQVSIEELLKQANVDEPAQSASASAGSPAAAATLGVAAPDAPEFELPSFQQAMQEAQASSIELLRDVELNVKIELGRSRMLVEDVLKLAEGSVVELDKLAGDPVDVFVNDRLVARGEVLVLNDNFCVRVNEIVAGVKDEGL